MAPNKVKEVMDEVIEKTEPVVRKAKSAAGTLLPEASPIAT